MKSKVRSGDIVQIKLPRDLGFGYAKCINLLELYESPRYPILIRVYNYRHQLPNVHIKEIINKDLILSPLLIAGVNPAISKGNWKVIGSEPLKTGEETIPHYKRPEPEDNPREWYYVIDADISKKIRSTHDSVKHLETLGATGSELVATKIAMALLRDEGKKIEDYFELTDFFEKEYYQDVLSIPAYYKQLQNIQGRAL